MALGQIEDDESRLLRLERDGLVADRHVAPRKVLCSEFIEIFVPQFHIPVGRWQPADTSRARPSIDVPYPSVGEIIVH